MPESNIAQILQQMNERYAAKEPVGQVGRGLLSANLGEFNPNTNPERRALFGAAQALLGGALHGIGQARVENRRQAVLDAYAQNAGNVSGLLSNPLTKEIGAAVQQDRLDAQQALQNRIDEKRIDNFFNPKTHLSGVPGMPGQQVRKRFDPTTQSYVEIPGLEPRSTITSQTTIDMRKPLDISKEEDRAYKRIVATPEYKALADLKPLYDTFVNVKDKDNRAADIALTAAFARVNDPGSTVREGEFKISQEASPLLRRYQAQLKSVVMGTGALDAKTRAEMFDVVNRKVGAFQKAYNTTSKRISDIAIKRTGGRANIDFILPAPIEEFSFDDAPSPAPALSNDLGISVEAAAKMSDDELVEFFRKNK